MSRSRDRGNSWERTCAGLFGGKRMPNDGKGGADVVTPTLVIECKRVDEASVRGAWIEQGREHSRAHGLPWLVVHARKGSSLSTTTMDTRLALELLKAAGMVPETLTDEEAA